MTFDELCSEQNNILELYLHGELTEAQLEREMEMLQEEYEENCEDC